jgi:carboxylate-amine ligase
MSAGEHAPFAVTGLEIEYPVVGRDFGIRRLVPSLLERLGGPGAADAALGPCGLSNEFVDHVVEIKNVLPLPRLAEVEADLAASVRMLQEILRREFDADLLPVAMHPWMTPEEAGLWPGEGRAIYEAYARLFPVRQQGWLNVQSCHVNLPFGPEDSCAAMLTACALLLPYLPALAAASPIAAGRVQEALSHRLVELWDLQGRVPESRGPFIPEYCSSFRQYEEEVLEPMYRAVDRLPQAQGLRADFFNSRSAVLKFGRRSLEIRILDVQECPRRDVAVAAFCRASLRALMRGVATGGILLPPHDLLVRDCRVTIVGGPLSRVAAPHLGGPARAGEVLRRLLDLGFREAWPDEEPHLAEAERMLAEGPLAARILRGLGSPGPGPVPRPELAALLRDLQSCLHENRPFLPGYRHG